MRTSQKSKDLRQDPLLLRDHFKPGGKLGIPLVNKSVVDITAIKLIGSDQISDRARISDKAKTVHFFKDDVKIEKYYSDPDKYLYRLAQYTHVLTPDYSLYPEMPLAVQIINTFKSRWCGAYWQEHNLSVIPTVSWSTAESFDFCFEGLERETVVSISSISSLKDKNGFLAGYNEMKKRINPTQVLCYGAAFPEMGDEVIVVDYLEATGRSKLWAAG